MNYLKLIPLGLSILLVTTSLSAKEQQSKKFTADRVFDMEYATDPQISPDGTSVVYVRHSMDRLKDVDKGQLWILNLSEGTNRPLVTGSASAGAPRWSPDGSRLIYATSNDGKPKLRMLYMDSGRSFSVAQFFEGPSEAEWSPNGKYIAFSIFVKSDKPSFATPLTPPEGATWNPSVNVIDDLVFRFDGAGY
jgi:dipeptidyl aminopeptidase/acylaminoacyl peptidase